MKDYHINIFYSDDDMGYIADIPDLNYCSAFGKNPLEALKEVQKAKKAWIKTAKEQGKSIPKPKYKPAIYQVAILRNDKKSSINSFIFYCCSICTNLFR